MALILSDAATMDLKLILSYTLRHFGKKQAQIYKTGFQKSFSFIEKFPFSTQERQENKDGLRAYSYKSHIILYRVEDDRSVFISRIRHASEDWLMAVDDDLI